jgi:ring-1,2-phenylacetyl-CoA epoxidase subunit PaaD
MAAARPLAATAERERLAWAALQDVPDPEVPVISVCELGIVREVHALPEGQGMEIVLPGHRVL